MAVTSLKRHKKIVHQLKIGKQIECADCGKLFQSKERLIQHLRVHALDAEENDLLSCTESAECKYKTNSRAYMSDHRRRIHQQDQANGCALLVRVKKSPDLFSTTTSIKNTSKIMQM